MRSTNYTNRCKGKSSYTWSEHQETISNITQSDIKYWVQWLPRLSSDKVTSQIQCDCETHYPSGVASSLIFLISAVVSFNCPAGNILARNSAFNMRVQLIKWMVCLLLKEQKAMSWWLIRPKLCYGGLRRVHCCTCKTCLNIGGGRRVSITSKSVNCRHLRMERPKCQVCTNYF